MTSPETGRTSGVAVPFGPLVPQADSVSVRLRDGVRLHTDVYLPAGSGRCGARRAGRGTGRGTGRRLPAVLIRTPYDKTHPDTLLPDIAARLSDAGWAVVAQDVRGKVRSEGATVPFVAEVADAWDILEWITTQPWSDGTVGCWGNSYYGFTAWAAVASGHPAVRALVSRLICTDLDGELIHRGGVFRLGPMTEWLHSTWAARPNLVPQLDWSRPAERLLAGLPDLRAAAAAGFAGREPGHGRVPTLHWAGWYDLFQTGQLRDWRRASAVPGGAPQYLVATATDHQDDLFTGDGRAPDHLTDQAARDAMLDRTLAPVITFFAHHLGGTGTGLTGRAAPPVQWQPTGHRLLAADRWPPPGARTLRLHLDGDALTPRSGTTPALARWEHDPDDPVPATDRDWWRPLLALPDERAVEHRPDVLTFTADPVDRPLQLAGPVRALLPVMGTAPETQLVAKLCAVAPDGTSRRILEAPARRRDGAVFDLLMGDTGYRLPPGHRLRLQIASSSHPLYASPAAPSGQRLRTGGHDGGYLDLTTIVL